LVRTQLILDAAVALRLTDADGLTGTAKNELMHFNLLVTIIKQIFDKCPVSSFKNLTLGSQDGLKWST
jgi:hypothetical protein